MVPQPGQAAAPPAGCILEFQKSSLSPSPAGDLAGALVFGVGEPGLGTAGFAAAVFLAQSSQMYFPAGSLRRGLFETSCLHTTHILSLKAGSPALVPKANGSPPRSPEHPIARHGLRARHEAYGNTHQSRDDSEPPRNIAGRARSLPGMKCVSCGGPPTPEHAADAR